MRGWLSPPLPLALPPPRFGSLFSKRGGRGRGGGRGGLQPAAGREIRALWEAMIIVLLVFHGRMFPARRKICEWALVNSRTDQTDRTDRTDQSSRWSGLGSLH